MNTDPIFATVAQLREAAGDGPGTRKLLDALFRHVHNLKANASANGLNNLADAAHEFENVLHSLRTGGQTPDALATNAIPADVWDSLKQEQKHTLQQTIAEGARIFLVQADFDVADFDRQFQSLKETLSKTGEVISRLARIDDERPGTINFKILYAQQPETTLGLLNDSVVTFEEISLQSSTLLEQAYELETIERSFEKLATALLKVPTVTSGDVFRQAVQAGRSAALATGKEVDFELRIHSKLNETWCEAIADPLVHLVRNAVDHGIETSEERLKLGKNLPGKIVIEAKTLDAQANITVTDDGRGIDAASLPLLFNPGFSTAGEVSAISGRGVGLDAVKTGIEEAGGSISVSTQLGRGSTFEIKLPLKSDP